MTTEVQAPSQAQLVATMAASLLPLVGGPIGLAASTLAPAALQLYESFTNHPGGNLTVADLVKIISVDNAAALAKLQAHVDALPNG